MGFSDELSMEPYLDRIIADNLNDEIRKDFFQYSWHFICTNAYFNFKKHDLIRAYFHAFPEKYSPIIESYLLSVVQHMLNFLCRIKIIRHQGKTYRIYKESLHDCQFWGVSFKMECDHHQKTE